MKAMKFRVESPEHSRQIQERLFEMGYSWSSGKKVAHIDKKYLYTNGSTIELGNMDCVFINKNQTETTLSDISPWQPKQGEMIEVSENGELWTKYPREFLSMYNGKYVCKHHTNDRWFPYEYARPINTIQREIDELQAKIDELKKRL